MEKVISYKPKQEYNVIHVQEGFFGVIFFGQSGINTQALEDTLNNYAKKGWYVVEMFVEKRRKLLFWGVDSVTIVFARDKE